MKQQAWRVVMVAVMALELGGCGLVVNGIHQDLAITSDPAGARVSVDGVPSGTTPIVAPLKRKHAHVVKVEQDGYGAVEASVSPGVSIWEWGNVLTFGPLGLAIDAWTGGMYELSSPRVHVLLPTDKKLAQATK